MFHKIGPCFSGNKSSLITKLVFQTRCIISSFNVQPYDIYAISKVATGSFSQDALCSNDQSLKCQ